VRARVQSNWRTRLLLLLAFVAAGVIAWHRVSEREAEEAAESRASAPSGDVVEVEIVGE